MNEQVIEKVADALARAVRRQLVSQEAAGTVAQKLGLKSRLIVPKIGRGAETLNQLRTSPAHGLQVAKVYNTEGSLFSKELFERKDKIYTAMSGKGNFAKYYGKDPSGRAVSFHEYIKPGSRPKPTTKAKRVGRLLMDKAKTLGTGMIARSKGMPIGDTLFNSGNVLEGKIIDFLPKNKAIMITTPMGALHYGLRGDIKRQLKAVLTLKQSPKAAIKNISDSRHLAPLLEMQMGLQVPKISDKALLKKTYGK
jgi:hypothetical protein